MTGMPVDCSEELHIYFFRLFYMNISAKWLWVLFILISLTYGAKVENALLEDLRNVAHLVVLILAIRASFFVKKDRQQEKDSTTKAEL
jgi:hypothetical protein